MNIKVTFPKKPANKQRLIPSLEHFRKLLRRKGYKVYFKIGNLPAKGNVTLGEDKVYYGWDNKFWGFFVIKAAKAVDAGKASTLENWDGTAGNFIISNAYTWQKLSEPIHYEKGFRGFQYWDE